MKKKNKIYFFHPYSGTGGADLSISRLINGLNHNKFEVDFLTLNKPKIKNKIKKKINYKIIKSKRTFFAFKLINKYIQDDIKFKKKIFISNQNFANTISVLFLKKFSNLKLILFERNHIDELKYFKDLIDFFKKKIIKILIKMFYKKADLIFTNSKISSNDLSKYIKHPVKTLYNPCFFKLYKRKKIKKKKLIILNVARFVDQKDHLTLLKGFNYSKFKSKFVLYLVGYGKNEKKIRDFIAENKFNNVKIIKGRFNLTNLYEKADLFILTSIFEGFPNVMVEAASFRIPIISSNFRSGSSEILMGGKGGHIFKVKDYFKLAKLIDNFYLNRKVFLQKEKECSKKLYRFSNNRIIKDFNIEIEKLIK